MAYQESRLGALYLLLWTVDGDNVQATLACGEGYARVGFRLDILDIDVFLPEQFAVKLMRD